MKIYVAAVEALRGKKQGKKTGWKTHTVHHHQPKQNWTGGKKTS